jgi:hypothetical protein
MMQKKELLASFQALKIFLSLLNKQKSEQILTTK